MSEIKIHVLHTGTVCVAPELPFGGDDCNPLKAAGLFGKKKDRIWLPVSSYLIQCDQGKLLFDCGWHRDMSPNGVFDRRAQIKSLGSIACYVANQGVLPKGEAINEQLAAMGIQDTDLDLVLLSHLDCDHANGLKLVAGAKKILASRDEIAYATNGSLMNRVRYDSNWWKGTRLEGFDWNGTEGPAGRSFDVFGDGVFQMINIPGHCDGLCALKITRDDGKFVLLFADGGYGRKSWEEQITSGICADKPAQKKSLAWIREQCLDENCIEALANHDTEIQPHIITL